MKVLVTGSRGQLVRSLVERAAGTAISVVAIGRPHLDLEVSGSAALAISTARPDVVINAAAYAAVDQAEDESERAFRVNADAAGEVAKAARAVGAPVIQISTDYVFDGNSAEPYREDHPTNPMGVYGRSKLAGEEHVRAANPHHLILRTSWMYSPFGRNFVKTMLRLALERDEIPVVADQQGTPTNALDVADALLAVLRSWRADERVSTGETLHFAGCGICSWAQLATEAFRLSAEFDGPRANVRPITTAEFGARAPRPRFSALDSTRFQRTFAIQPRNWHQPLREVVARLARGGTIHGG